MDFLSRRLKINNWEEVTYPIMTKQEAEERELEFVYWKEAKTGELTLSDDGYVSECLKRKKYKKAEEITVPYGRMWINNHAKLLYEPHRDTGEYSQSGTRPWVEREMSLQRTKNAVKLYVNMMLGTGKIDWEQIGKAYRPDQAKPAVTAKRLFKQKRISSMVDEKIQEYLDERELNQGDVLDVIAEAITIARNNADPSNMLRGAEQYIKIMDMLPSKTQQTDTLQIDVSKKILDEIATEETRQLKLESTKEVPNGKDSA
tara:strand:+ start:1169 stop:1945 length:777 start_codon:yes stop_codon:yes gene_type:complete